MFTVVSHVLSILEFQSLCDLGVFSFEFFPKLVGELVVDLIIGSPFVYV